MVLMHGFAGGSALFYPLFKQLVKHFDVILIDNIGMGGSSRPNDFDEDCTPQQSVDYFVNFFEKWRCKMKKVLFNWK